MTKLIPNRNQRAWKAASYFLRGLWALWGRHPPGCHNVATLRAHAGAEMASWSHLKWRNRHQAVTRISRAGWQDCALEVPGLMFWDLLSGRKRSSVYKIQASFVKMYWFWPKLNWFFCQIWKRDLTRAEVWHSDETGGSGHLSDELQ